MHEKSAITRGRTLNYAAGVYDILSPPMTFWQESNFNKKVIDLIKYAQGQKILDVGCGTGTLTIDIAEKLKTELCVGVDAAGMMAYYANQKVRKRKVDNVMFLVAAAEKLPCDNEIFDVAVSTFFFHHVDFQLKVQALNEIYRTLKPGRKLIVVDVDTPTNLFGKICAYCGYYLFRQPEIKENIDGLLRKAFEQSNFGSYKIISRHQGYISVFVVEK